MPEHWTIRRLKYVASINDEALSETTSPDYELVYVDIGGVEPFAGITSTEELVFENAPSRARRIVRSGDTVVSTVRTYLRAIAPIHSAQENLVVSTGFAVIRPRRIKPEFLSYALRETGFVETIVARSTGVSYPAINASEIGTITIALPPQEDQTAIANFLDRKTAEIDALVFKKRNLIEKLQEKRSALISRTVTRGLPDRAVTSGHGMHKFRTTTIQWIGEIPSHWKVVPLRFIALIGNGSTPNRDNPEYWEDGTYPWLNSAVVNQEQVTYAEQFVTKTALAECHLPRIEPPAVLIGITGQGRTRGRATILQIESTINQHVAYLRPNTSVADVRYLRRVFDRAYEYLRSESDGAGSTKGAITCEQLAATHVPLPPLNEQIAIADYLYRETAKIDALIVKVEQAIERLQEYRTALITAAVTGKIDVRHQEKVAGVHA